MNRDQAKEIAKGYLETYLQTRHGVKEPRRGNFRCIRAGHNDSTPSMTYYADTQRVFCHGCKESGDIFDVVSWDTGLTGAALFDEVYKMYGITIDGGNAEQGGSAPRTGNNISLKGDQNAGKGGEMQETPRQDYTEYFKTCAARIGETDFPQKRRLPADIVARFGLGYDPAWRHPLRKNDPLTPRLIIPNGAYHYTARDVRDVIPEEEQKTPIKMKCGRDASLFNADALYNSARPVFVVEGEIDAMSIETVGGCAVALGSAANGEKLIKQIKQQTPPQPLIIALDNDDKKDQDGNVIIGAGTIAADKIEAELKARGIPYYRPDVEKLWTVGKDANDVLKAGDYMLFAAIQEAEERAADIAQDAARADYEAYLGNCAGAHLDALFERIAESANEPIIKTDFAELDKALGGVLFHGLYIIGAISALGKTTFVMQIADNIAKQGHDVLILSLEMSRDELMARSISRITYENAMKENAPRNAKTINGILDGRRYNTYETPDGGREDGYTDTELKAIEAAKQDYAKYADKIFIHECEGNVGVEELRNMVEKHKRITGRAPVVIVDYLQILPPYNERYADKQNVDANVRELKRISRKYRIPVIAVSSLNRDNYNMPANMAAFKESGAIEYSSDVLIGMHLKGVPFEGSDKHEKLEKAKSKMPRDIEMLILKSRRSGNKQINYIYEQKYFCFKESQNQTFDTRTTEKDSNTASDKRSGTDRRRR